MPLGVPVQLAAHSDRVAAEVVVPPGAVLVWCTDGLVERRGEDLDVGLQRLADLARDLPPVDLRSWCATVVDRMVGGEHLHDDVALLCVRSG